MAVFIVFCRVKGRFVFTCLRAPLASLFRFWPLGVAHRGGMGGVAWGRHGSFSVVVSGGGSWRRGWGEGWIKGWGGCERGGLWRGRVVGGGCGSEWSRKEGCGPFVLCCPYGASTRLTVMVMRSLFFLPDAEHTCAAGPFGVASRTLSALPLAALN